MRSLRDDLEEERQLVKLEEFAEMVVSTGMYDAREVVRFLGGLVDLFDAIAMVTKDNTTQCATASAKSCKTVESQMIQGRISMHSNLPYNHR